MLMALQQQMMGGMTTRRTRGSVGSLDGGRVFNDAVAWISQQKVRGSHKGVTCGRETPPPPLPLPASTSRFSDQLSFASLSTGGDEQRPPPPLLHNTNDLLWEFL